MSNREGRAVSGRQEAEAEAEACSRVWEAAVRGHPQLYVPLYIPYLLFIFHLHFALLT